MSTRLFLMQECQWQVVFIIYYNYMYELLMFTRSGSHKIQRKVGWQPRRVPDL
jgi:hypothetical protein